MSTTDTLNRILAEEGRLGFVETAGGVVDWLPVPARYRGGLDRWICSGIPPGDFLQAVLRNDLAGAAARSDDNCASLPALVRFLHNEAPRSCFGDDETVKLWAATGGLNGRATTQAAMRARLPS